MSLLFGMRFDFRNPDLAGTTLAERYAAALDMAEWADQLACVSIAVSEHHCSPDGYLPSPLPMLAAFAGEPFEFRGRTVHVTPPPYRAGGPGIILGGSSEAAARRAARIADGFLPSVPEVWRFYRDEVQQLGRPDPGPSPIGENLTIALAEDVEHGWKQMGPFFLHENNAYGTWQAQDDVASPYKSVDDVDQLRATGQYSV